MFGRLIDSGGNECALVRSSYSPCRREIAGEAIDEAACPLVAAAAGLAPPISLFLPSDADRAQRFLEGPACSR